MKQNYTEILVVLDRSGSMASIKNDTIGGFNRFLEDQQKVPGEAKITLAQFDEHYEVVLNAVPVKDAKPLNDTTYVPRGSTALYGAIGRTIDEAGRRFAAMPESERPEKVVVLIITDGQENASHGQEWSKQYAASKIKEMVEHQSNAYKWQFVYIGANQDAVMNAQGIGIQSANALNYTSNSVGTQALYASVTDNLRSYRMATKKDMSWEAKDRQEQDAALTR
jgi:hypothetical protein